MSQFKREDLKQQTKPKFNIPCSRPYSASLTPNSKLPLKNKNQNDLNQTPHKNTDKNEFSKQINPQHHQQQQSSSNPLRLLVGKLVFLDIQNSFKQLNKVKECLTLIEAVSSPSNIHPPPSLPLSSNIWFLQQRIADCLSKDVNYVITNRDSPASPSLTHTDSQNTESNKKPSRTSPNTINFLSRSSSLINRTQAILEKASKGHTSTDILATARRLGINVMNVGELERYIEKYMNKKKSLEAVDKANVSIEYDESKTLTSQAVKDLYVSSTADVLSQTLVKKNPYDKLSNHKSNSDISSYVIESDV